MGVQGLPGTVLLAGDFPLLRSLSGPYGLCRHLGTFNVLSHLVLFWVPLSARFHSFRSPLRSPPVTPDSPTCVRCPTSHLLPLSGPSSGSHFINPSIALRAGWDLGRAARRLSLHKPLCRPPCRVGPRQSGGSPDTHRLRGAEKFV